MKNKDILVLPSWYPSEIENSAGDFIQRHIEAIALYCRQHVIHVVKDENGKITKNVTSIISEKYNFSEEIIYYHIKKSGFNLLDKFLSNKKYKKVYKKAIQKYIQKRGIPLLIHVHVAMKAGIIASWIKKKYSIPYVVSEHWSGYLTESPIKFKKKNFFFKFWTKKILLNSVSLTVVSDYLGKSLQQLFPFIKYTVIPNVVNPDIFFPVKKEKSDKTIFIHASTMNYEKNVEGILNAFQIVKKTSPDFFLKLYGGQKEELIDLINSLDLNDNISVYGEVPQKELALAMQQSDALIMNSRFETFGCVVIEANACGLPAIVTNIPVWRELITENVNGIFTKENNPENLAEEILSFINKMPLFNQLEIANSAEKYSYKNVGLQFYNLYQWIKNHCPTFLPDEKEKKQT